jgi:hypothetical protein
MRQIMISGTTLYAVAASELGDATLWSVLADTNNLNDPLVVAPTTLLIPDVTGD